MKTCLFKIFAFAVLLMAASCSSQEEPAVENSENSENVETRNYLGYWVVTDYKIDNAKYWTDINAEYSDEYKEYEERYKYMYTFGMSIEIAELLIFETSKWTSYGMNRAKSYTYQNGVPVTINRAYTATWLMPINIESINGDEGIFSYTIYLFSLKDEDGLWVSDIDNKEAVKVYVRAKRDDFPIDFSENADKSLATKPIGKNSSWWQCENYSYYSGNIQSIEQYYFSEDGHFYKYHEEIWKVNSDYYAAENVILSTGEELNNVEFSINSTNLSGGRYWFDGKNLKIYETGGKDGRELTTYQCEWRADNKLQIGDKTYTKVSAPTTSFHFAKGYEPEDWQKLVEDDYFPPLWGL